MAPKDDNETRVKELRLAAKAKRDAIVDLKHDFEEMCQELARNATALEAAAKELAASPPDDAVITAKEMRAKLEKLVYLAGDHGRTPFICGHGVASYTNSMELALENAAQLRESIVTALFKPEKAPE